MWDVLHPRLQAIGAHEIPARSLGYDAMIGNVDFRTKLAAFLGRELLGRSVKPEQLAVLSGAGTVLELLFHAIADAGDGVLVPTPSYAGFWADLETRDELKIVPVATTSTTGFRLTIEALDAAVANAGCPIRALLFTTPDNPLGRVYARESLAEILSWAQARDIHVVFDEIYGLSVFGEAPFVSVASLRPSLGDRVHVVWAFSKDFGASGLRCGVLFSENEAVLRAVDGLAYWGAVSGDTQWRLAALLDDRDFLASYLGEMRRRLAATYAEVTATLDAHRIPYLPAGGGIFVLCDLRAHLDEPTFAAEDRLWRRLVERANVNLTPGAACRIAEPGFFRLCYAAEPREAVRIGVERVAAVLRSQG
jgi:aspartate/methionine/tyrosine aminotransferase